MTLFRRTSGNVRSCLILSSILIILTFLLANNSHAFFSIVRNGIPDCSIIIPEESSSQERFAVNELNYFIRSISEATLGQHSDSEPMPDGNIILIGTFDDNKHINELFKKGLVARRNNLDEEEFLVKVVQDDRRNFLIIAGSQGRSVIYGVYAFVEKIIENVTGLSPVDLDFHVPKFPSLSVATLNIRSAPFYPVRCSLSQENPTWMSRHRLNVSGADGVWTGTGIDDGLGTAFKYVYDSQFDDMQDESRDERLKRITSLRARFMELQDRGIDSYLFMYVMGEPTKATMVNHPELLENPVEYKHSRNGSWYQPISWTKPASRQLIKGLVKSIVRTYSPWLKGFHLRSWGGETRAPAGNDEQQQNLLWEIYFDIINSAHEVNPDIKFIISGYDGYWLKDPDRKYAKKLPKGTILMQKWGVDGEPTDDPAIPSKFINEIADAGQRVLILSHDVEEVMPLWMVEADLFIKGVRKYANNLDLKGLAGFTLQGHDGLAHLDKLVSAQICWNPYLDYVALMNNYLSSYYGEKSAQNILASIRANSLILSDYFSDYAGSVSLTGGYGHGSRGYAMRFWNIVGRDAVKDVLSIPDQKMAEYAKGRFASIIPRQQESANEMAMASRVIQPVSKQALQDYNDGLHLMRMWVRFFESRLRLVEALEVGFGGSSTEQVMQKISSSAEYSREMQAEISQIAHFVGVFNHDNQSARESLVVSISEEIDFLKNFDPNDIIINSHDSEDDGKKPLAITYLLIHPNPVNTTATFCYDLTSSADEVKISIYTVTGKQVRTIHDASGRSGYNEQYWNGRDDDGKKLASGTYFYKMMVKRNNEKAQKIGKMSVVR